MRLRVKERGGGWFAREVVEGGIEREDWVRGGRGEGITEIEVGLGLGLGM